MPCYKHAVCSLKFVSSTQITAEICCLKEAGSACEDPIAKKKKPRLIKHNFGVTDELLWGAV